LSKTIAGSGRQTRFPRLWQHPPCSPKFPMLHDLYNQSFKHSAVQSTMRISQTHPRIIKRPACQIDRPYRSLGYPCMNISYFLFSRRRLRYIHARCSSIYPLQAAPSLSSLHQKDQALNMPITDMYCMLLISIWIIENYIEWRIFNEWHDSKKPSPCFKNIAKTGKKF